VATLLLEIKVSNCFSDMTIEDSSYIAACALKEKKVVQGYSDGTFKPANVLNRAELLKFLLEGDDSNRPTLENYKNCFPDVSKEWFAPYVCAARQQKYISGYPNGRFKPGNPVNKVEALKIMFNVLQIPVKTSATKTYFKDIPISEWYAPYVQAGVELGIIPTEGVDFLKPTEGMTREDIAESVYQLYLSLGLID